MNLRSTGFPAVQGWLCADGRPLGAALGQAIANVETYRNAQGGTLYYVVNLRPSGFVIVPADDDVEPVIAFAASGRYDPSPENPLGALVNRDVPGRITAARAKGKAGPPAPRAAGRSHPRAK